MPIKVLTAKIYAERAGEEKWNPTSRKTSETENIPNVEENDFQ